MYVHTWRPKISFQCCSLGVVYLVFEKQSFTGLELSKQVKLADRDLPVSLSPALGLKVYASHLDHLFYTYLCACACRCAHAGQCGGQTTGCTSQFFPTPHELQGLKLSGLVASTFTTELTLAQFLMWAVSTECHFSCFHGSTVPREPLPHP